jgi:microcin C transport system substrate-binding protein
MNTVSVLKRSIPNHTGFVPLAIGVLFSTVVWVQSVQAQDTVIKSHGISTFGELKYSADFPHLDYVNPDAPKGGSFSTWGFGTFDSLMPYILKGQAASLASAQFETLMVGTADEPDSMYGLLAESIEYPEDRQWAIFNIRPEARFSDGTPVTAVDVVFSFNILIEKGRPSFASTFSDFEMVEALAPLRVKFTFKEGSNTRELPQAAAGLPVFSKAYFDDVDFAESTMTPPIGSGDYILKSAEPGKNVVYQRRDDYWGKDLSINVGRSNFDEIGIEYFGDYTVAFEAFKGGAYTFREEYLSKLWATSYDFPALEKGWVRTDTLLAGRPSGTQGYWFNLRRDKFKDPKVREAIGMMFNFEWSNKALFYGIYDRTDSFWENSPMQAEGMITDAERALLEPLAEHLPDTVFTDVAFTPVVSKPNQLDRNVFRAAGKLLDAAGWTPQGKFRKNDKGETLTIDFLNDSPSFERITNPLVENLIKLGVDARLKSVDPAQETELTKVFDFDVKVQRFSMSLTPGLELRSIFSSETADAEGGANLSGVSNPAVDALLDIIEGAKTRDELTVAVKALDRTLRAMHIWIPQWYKGTHNVAYLDMYEHPENLPPYSMGEMDFWWYNAEKAAKLKAEGAF